ncbi:MAG: hypothetical protein JSW61_05300 [Candidatus Thorarchaeota archaeon]|nr:MAG: hypothetical protein JSW61_05300 [Candidatus Thorarchaeota archaeon]
MRVCKCGKANNPTRKFCVRCGANLITQAMEEEPAKEAVAPVKAETTPPAAEVATTAPRTPPAESAPERMVRPSEVNQDRMRRTEPKVKSELEKAREAFARAEEVGIEEGGEGIVESRMLRASEVRELLEKAEDFAVQVEPPVPEAPSEGVTTPAAPAVPTSRDLEESILGSKSVLVEHDEPVVEAAPEPEPYVEPIVQPEPAAAPPPEPAAPVTPVESRPEPIVEAAAPPPKPEPVVEVAPAKAPTTEAVPAVVPEVSEIEMKILDTDYLNDKKINGSLTDLRHLYTELKHVQSELEDVTTRQDEIVQQYRNDMEVKRVRYEGLREQTLAAKDEWKDAEKELELSDKRRTKEILSRRKRLEKIDSGIKKGKSTIEKRVRDLDKEKEKRAEKAKKLAEKK